MAKKIENKSAQTTEVKDAAPTPDEKVLSDTLMKEMEPAPEPTPELAPTQEEKPVQTNVSAPEAVSTPKKGLPKISLPFGKKKPQDPEPVQTEAPATAEAQQLTNEALMEMIDEKLKTISGEEFVTIKISKTGLLFLIGFALVIIWLLSATNMATKLPAGLSFNRFGSVKNQPPSTPMPLSVRVRIGSDSPQEAEAIKNALINAGMAKVDVVNDPQVNPTQLLVVTREGEEALRTQLFNLFVNAYAMASESATLTEDSDYAATILVGSKSAKLK